MKAKDVLLEICRLICTQLISLYSLVTRKTILILRLANI